MKVFNIKFNKTFVVSEMGHCNDIYIGSMYITDNEDSMFSDKPRVIDSVYIKGNIMIPYSNDGIPEGVIIEFTGMEIDFDDCDCERLDQKWCMENVSVINESTFNNGMLFNRIEFSNGEVIIYTD